MSTPKAAVESLRADIDIEARVSEFEALFVEAAEDTVMASLFAPFEIPPPPPQEHAKRFKGRWEDEARVRKKERREIEAVWRALLAD